MVIQKITFAVQPLGWFQSLSRNSTSDKTFKIRTFRNSCGG
jgi:hypothetical protein